MLHIWMERNVLFYGMIGAGILGILCMFMVDRFYGRAIRDVRRITEPKGKWTKEFLKKGLCIYRFKLINRRVNIEERRACIFLPEGEKYITLQK